MEQACRDSIILRHASAEDLPFIRDIELVACTPAWPASALAAELNRQDAINTVAADSAGALYGYAFAARVADEVSIHYIVTHPNFRRRRIAAKLVEATIARAAAAGARSAFLEVRSKNAAARALYALCGFSEISRRKRYYANDNDDAVVMHRSI